MNRLSHELLTRIDVDHVQPIAAKVTAIAEVVPRIEATLSQLTPS